MLSLYEDIGDENPLSGREINEAFRLVIVSNTDLHRLNESLRHVEVYRRRDNYPCS